MIYIGTLTTVNGTSKNAYDEAIFIDGFWERLLIVTPASAATFYVRILPIGIYNNTVTASVSDFGCAEQTSSQFSLYTSPGVIPYWYNVAFLASGGAGDLKIYGLSGQAQS